MTEVRAVHVVCEAAAQEDDEAADFLRQRLDTRPPRDAGKATLLMALAWLDPEEALERAEGLVELSDFVLRDIDKLHKARALCSRGADQQSAYHTLTALLPRESETMRRRQIYYWSVALRSPGEFLALPEWFLIESSPFLTARLWHRCTESFWEALQGNQKFQARFSSIGQIVLANRASEKDIAILVEFLKTRSATPPYTGLAASALFQAIGVLEVRAPQEIAALAPGILRALGKSLVDKDSILTARVLVMLARLDLTDTLRITPLVERVKGQQNHRVARRWARHTARMVRQLEPGPSVAHQLARVLRLLALEKSLESALTRKLDRRSMTQVRRAWRWLQKGDRVIETVADIEWRKHFRRSKVNLEQKVRRSRKKVHIMARAGDER